MADRLSMHVLIQLKDSREYKIVKIDDMPGYSPGWLLSEHNWPKDPIWRDDSAGFWYCKFLQVGAYETCKNRLDELTAPPPSLPQLAGDSQLASEQFSSILKEFRELSMKVEAHEATIDNQQAEIEALRVTLRKTVYKSKQFQLGKGDTEMFISLQDLLTAFQFGVNGTGLVHLCREKLDAKLLDGKCLNELDENTLAKVKLIQGLFNFVSLTENGSTPSAKQISASYKALNIKLINKLNNDKKEFLKPKTVSALPSIENDLLTVKRAGKNQHTYKKQCVGQPRSKEDPMAGIGHIVLSDVTNSLVPALDIESTDPRLASASAKPLPTPSRAPGSKPKSGSASASSSSASVIDLENDADPNEINKDPLEIMLQPGMTDISKENWRKN